MAVFGGLAFVFVTSTALDHTPTWVQVTIVCIAPVALGIAVPASAAALSAASWTWLVPTIFFAIGFTWEASTFGLVTTFGNYFATSGIGDNDKLATVIITLPTVWTIAYSLGAAVRRRANTRRAFTPAK